MKLSEHLENFEKQLLKEDVSTTGAIGGFTGKHGQSIDTKFAGPYHPDFGEIKKLLKKQIDDNNTKSMYSMLETPKLESHFKFLDISLEQYKKLLQKRKDFDREQEEKREKYANNDSAWSEWKSLVDKEIEDKQEQIKTAEKFTNKTNNWKYICDLKNTGE